MFSLIAFLILYAVGMIATLVMIKCWDNNSDSSYRDRSADEIATFLWPLTFVLALMYYIYKLLEKVANLIVSKLCPGADNE